MSLPPTINNFDNTAVYYFLFIQGADYLRSDGTIVLTVGADDDFLSRVSGGSNNHWTTFEEALSPDNGIKARFHQIIDQFKREGGREDPKPACTPEGECQRHHKGV